MHHVYDIMGPPGRRIARHVRDSSIPLTVDGTARRVPGKGPGTGSGRVGRRAAVLPGFVYFVSIHTVSPVPRGPLDTVVGGSITMLSLARIRWCHRWHQGSEGVNDY